MHFNANVNSSASPHLTLSVEMAGFLTSGKKGSPAKVTSDMRGLLLEIEEYHYNLVL